MIEELKYSVSLELKKLLAKTLLEYSKENPNNLNVEQIKYLLQLFSHTLYRHTHNEIEDPII